MNNIDEYCHSCMHQNKKITDDPCLGCKHSFPSNIVDYYVSVDDFGMDSLCRLGFRQYDKKEDKNASKF